MLQSGMAASNSLRATAAPDCSTRHNPEHIAEKFIDFAAEDVVQVIGT